MYFADLLTKCFASRRFEQLLRHRFMGLRRSAGPRAVWREAEVGIDGVSCEVRVDVMQRPSLCQVVLWVGVLARKFRR
jgi:hypothetical protein